MASWKFMVTVFYLVSLAALLLARKPVELPPSIIEHPKVEIAFRAGEKVEIPCRAFGEPPPVYTWTKNDQPLAISNIDIKQLPSVGTIEINEPKSSNEGIYQCTATNNFGKALSVKTVLKRAVMEPFPSVKKPKILRPQVGMPLMLRCQPPFSYPQALVYWGESKAGDRLKPIDSTDRISLDYEGNLHFSNVRVEDGLSDRHTKYVCASFNEVIRSVVQGEDQRIVPIQLPGTPKHEAPKLMWPVSSTKEVALKGESKKMKCIFSGYPTPSVNWTRVDAPLPPKVFINSYGQEITIPDADYSDVGSYKCTGRNIVSEASRTVTLHVESPPYWKDDQPPEDTNASEEESVRFDCLAIGQPKPDIAWFINGVPVQKLPPEPRRTIGKDYLIYLNVTKADAQVIQCNTSNVHGYIFANAFLNVQAEIPSFIETPQAVVKVAEGQNITLTCQVFGAPKPVITWNRTVTGSTSPKHVSGDRFMLENSGNLRILNAVKEDQGTYYCLARNKLGDDKASGELLVRSKTFITEAPVSQTVNASNDVTFHCSAITDPAEKTKLKIDWLKNNKKINYEREGSISKNIVDNSLKITQAQVSDSGNYTCNASNGLDSHSVTVKFTVKGRPDPPQLVHYTTCGTSYATVAWTKGNDNNDPITQYIVYYNTSFDEPDKFHTGTPVAGEKLTAKIFLKPWTNYTFHVRAKNDLGLSDRSNFSPAICVTSPSRPFRHPNGVCTESGAPNELIIVWEPMLRREHNGEGFRYVVSYKPLNNPDADEEKRIVNDWRQSQLIVGNQGTFQKYEIYVQAENDEGMAAESQLKKKIGYSGQDIPLDWPQNFRINNQTLNSTSVEFLWDPVDMSPERIRGFFRGYQIRFWKTDDPKHPRVEDIILHSWNPCPELPSLRYRRQSTSDGEEPVKGHTNRLWPFSRITAGVLVLNAGKSGQLSETLEFTTPEGVPSMVPDFQVIERGSHHMKLVWSKPAEPNGILHRYEIEYRKAPPAIDQIKLVKVLNPEQKHKKIHELQNDTEYIFYIYAVTNAGRGPVTYIEESTLPSSAPSEPVIAEMNVGDGSVNISWISVADTSEPPHNPGNMFFLEYRKAGSDKWEKTEPEEEHNWMNVTDLEKGAPYEFVVVAKNIAGEETRSGPRTVTIIRPEEAHEKPNVASAGWFICLMCAIAFLLLILLLICLIKRNRGGKYAVHEKEKLRGHDSAREDDEAGFGEYTRTPHMELKFSEDMNKSRGSLESEEKPLDSESDSLGEYDDPDPSKFNEDGSFIGQYGGKKKSGERLDHDATTPSALSTFV